MMKDSLQNSFQGDNFETQMILFVGWKNRKHMAINIS